jgi:hypothetical protein
VPDSNSHSSFLSWEKEVLGLDPAGRPSVPWQLIRQRNAGGTLRQAADGPRVSRPTGTTEACFFGFVGSGQSEWVTEMNNLSSVAHRPFIPICYFPGPSVAQGFLT